MVRKFHGIKLSYVVFFLHRGARDELTKELDDNYDEYKRRISDDRSEVLSCKLKLRVQCSNSCTCMLAHIQIYDCRDFLFSVASVDMT